MFLMSKETPSPALKTQSTPGKDVGSINLDFANVNDLILPIEVERLKAENSDSSSQKFTSPSWELDHAVDFITDDILSMMCYGDIHES